MSAPIRIHIDRLVLDPAFAHLDRNALGVAVEGELGRLLAERGSPATLGSVSHRARSDGGRFLLSPNSGAESIGRQVAQSVYRGLGR